MSEDEDKGAGAQWGVETPTKSAALGHAEPNPYGAEVVVEVGDKCEPVSGIDVIDFAPDDEIELRFTYHAPGKAQVVRLETVRAVAKSMAYVIKNFVPEGRERSHALTCLETAVMFANAGIARHVKPEVEPEPTS